jgi:tetratricopeptide (TPR) repeat protein
MKLIMKYLNLSGLIIIELFFLQSLTAQSFDETVDYADKQFISGNLETALKTYQRALIAEISYIRNDYTNAYKFYGLAYNQTNTDSLKTDLLFKKATCQMLMKNFQYAIIDLLSVIDTSLSVQKRINFYLGTCYFGLEDFDNAQFCFSFCVKDEDKQDLAKLFLGNKLSSPKPEKAKIISMIIPGMGQIYSGNFRSGINSIFLTSGLVVLGIHLGVRYHPIDAVFTILPWYQRYYTGGYGNAEEIAISKRQRNRNEVYTSVLRLISEN